MMNKISSCLKWTWSGGPSPGLCHATMTEVAPPVASVVRSTSMSRPKGLIDNACLGVTTAGCNGVRASMDVVSHSFTTFYLVRRSWHRRKLSHVPMICLGRFYPGDKFGEHRPDCYHREHGFTRAHRTPGRGRSAFSRVVPLVAYGLYAINTALHSPSLRQLSADPRSRSVPPAQISL